MQNLLCLGSLGFAEYYYLNLDNNKILNKKTNNYLSNNTSYTWKLLNKENKYKSISLKEIYLKLLNKVFCIDQIDPLEGEIFKEIEGTDGNYYASNKGRIKSYKGIYATILIPNITPTGYERLQLTINGKRCTKLVHCLVASAWLDPPKSLDYEVHHIDRNKRNNSSDNLVYLLKSEHRKIHSQKKEDPDE